MEMNSIETKRQCRKRIGESEHGKVAVGHEEWKQKSEGNCKSVSLRQMWNYGVTSEKKKIGKVVSLRRKMIRIIDEELEGALEVYLVPR